MPGDQNEKNYDMCGPVLLYSFTSAICNAQTQAGGVNVHPSLLPSKSRVLSRFMDFREAVRCDRRHIHLMDEREG